MIHALLMLLAVGPWVVEIPIEGLNGKNAGDLEARILKHFRTLKDDSGNPYALAVEVADGRAKITVMCAAPFRLDDLAPIENAAMADRTVLEWDKDDLDALGILKIDVLALGMLSCIAKGFALIKSHYGKAYDLATIPKEDPAVYDMLCQADSIGLNLASPL